MHKQNSIATINIGTELLVMDLLKGLLKGDSGLLLNIKSEELIKKMKFTPTHNKYGSIHPSANI